MFWMYFGGCDKKASTCTSRLSPSVVMKFDPSYTYSGGPDLNVHLLTEHNVYYNYSKPVEGLPISKTTSNNTLGSTLFQHELASHWELLLFLLLFIFTKNYKHK